MRTRPGCCIALAVLLLILGSGRLSAQEPPIHLFPREVSDSLLIIDNDKPEGLDRAVRLMQFGEYAPAADLLELIHQQAPASPAVKNLLAECYERLKDFDRLLLFMKQRLAAEPPGYPLYRDVGRAYMLAGFPDSAETFLYAAAHEAQGKTRAFRSIADIYYSFGYYDAGARFIDSARVLTGDPRLLAGKMGDALAAQQDFAAATLEYLEYMDEDTLSAREAEDKIIALMRFPESADTVIVILSEQIRVRADNRRLVTIYGQLLMEQDRYDQAYAFFRELDSLGDGNGGDFIYFIRECNNRKQYEYTLEASQYFLRAHPQSALVNNVYFALADAYIAVGRYEDALAAYQTVADEIIRPAHKADANLKIGLLYKDYLHDLGRAREYLDNLVRLFPSGDYYVEAMIALADIAVKEHRFDTAISLLSTLQELELPEDKMEAIEYMQAQVFLFMQNYSEANLRYRQVISRYPRGLYVNDAIQYALIVGETLQEAADHMDLFSAAEYYRYTGQDDSLEYFLTRICRIGIPSLAPLSYVNLARLYVDQERFDEAVASIDSLSTLYPESYFFPYGVKLKADILLRSPDTREEALAIYRKLLQEYATYPFAAKIRNIVRRETSADRI